MIENKYTRYKDFIADNCKHLYQNYGLFVEKKTVEGIKRFLQNNGICYDFSNVKAKYIFSVGTRIGNYRYNLTCYNIQGNSFLKMKKYLA